MLQHKISDDGKTEATFWRIHSRADDESEAGPSPMECRTLMGNTQSFKFNFRVAGKVKIKEETLVAKTADRRELFKPHKTTPKQISILKENSTALLLGVGHFSATFSHVHFCNILILEEKKTTRNCIKHVGLKYDLKFYPQK